MSYHISRDGKKLGVFSEDEVIAGIEKGELLASDELWTEGMEDWQPVHEVIEVDEPDEEPATPSEPEIAQPTPEPEAEPIADAAAFAPPLEESLEVEPEAAAPAPTPAPPTVVYVPVGPSIEMGQYGVAGTAIASMVLGILGFVLLFLSGIPAIFAGHVARRQIRRSGGAYSGDGLAVAGLITGYVTSIVSIGWALLLLMGAPVPLSQSLSEWKTERLVKAEGRELAYSLKNYASTHAMRFPASMKQLVADKGINQARLNILQRTDLGPNWKGDHGWKYMGDGNQDTDSNDRPLLISNMEDSNGQHLVIYHDGTAGKAEIVSK